MPFMIAAASRALPPAAAGKSAPLRLPDGGSIGAIRSLSKDQSLYAEGDSAASFYKVVSGVVRTCRLLRDGRRQIAAFQLPGDIFGIEHGNRHRFAAEAVGDVTVIAYRRGRLDTPMSSDDGLAREAMDAVVAALERAERHMLLLGRKGAMEKVATFLLDMAGRVHGSVIELPMSRIDIADHLGLTIETVSRSLTHLERDGTIALPATRRTVVIRQMAALRRLEGL
ncbi:transcriptional regulator [Aureimonas sp. SA4125]|uniref:helix-turn-helix domain-containing protein n=1 Tax=Aureimonas sp. SA4125 TaxID=2826993 RepID=UPI001CC464EB|nr:helix-turn-helix domain-containing protein [Aureimonas sp. SA4125]BDA85686.1 transcriptional regulator [Aureimonas sp. SA4125]